MAWKTGLKLPDPSTSSASSAKEYELVNKTKREAKYHHLQMSHGFHTKVYVKWKHIDA